MYGEDCEQPVMADARENKDTKPHPSEPNAKRHRPRTEWIVECRDKPCHVGSCGKSTLPSVAKAGNEEIPGEAVQR